MVTPRPPARELSELEAVQEDLATARQALRASWSAERALQAAPPESAVTPAAAVAPRASSDAGLREENARLRRDLATVLSSPTWKAGSVATALPRWVRDRRAGR